MQNNILFLVVSFAVMAASLGAQAQLVNPPNYPPNASGVENFDWQAEWGTIHLNSFADGLLDPGTPVSRTGQVECPQGEFCTSRVNTSLDQTGRTPFRDVIGTITKTPLVENGIKYDIKNSLLNCVSKKVPNWSYRNNSAYTEQYVCIGNFSMPKSSEDAYAHPEKRTMIHLPLWDARSNDARSSDLGQKHGCQQQVTNGCNNIRDIHGCIDEDSNQPMVPGEKPGYEYPVTHVFTPQEVVDLGGTGAQIPNRYYSYDKYSATISVSNSPVHPSDVREDGKPIKYIDVTESDADVYGWGPQTTENILKTDCVDVAEVKNVSACASTSPSKCDCKIKHWVVVSSEKRYSYKKIDMDPDKIEKGRLSLTSNPASAVPGSVKTINTGSDPALARLKSYRMENNDPLEVRSTSIIVDPSDFYDLRHYAAGGKYNTGYSQFDAKGLVETPDTCPVLGLTSGYSGICDPTGNAGCNLPIYGVGPNTKFVDVGGDKFEYNDFPIIWSGYAKKWAVIPADKYLENIKSRKSYGGANLYLQGIYINKNPVVMLTRAKEYCDNRELSSKPVKYDPDHPPVADMECIQYLQYQAIDKKTPIPTYAYVDLYAPDEDPQLPGHVEYNVLHLYNIDKDGKVVNAVKGSGPNEFVGDGSKDTGFLSFKDFGKADSVYSDLSKGIVNASAFEQVEYEKGDVPKYDPVSKKRISDGPVFGTENIRRPGEYLAIDDKGVPDTSKGTGIITEPGTAMIIGMDSKVAVVDPKTGLKEEAPCAVVSAPIGTGAKIFIPTNTQEEFQAFLDASNEKDKDGKKIIQQVASRKCSTSFKQVDTAPLFLHDGDYKGGADGTTWVKSKTWSGKLSCDSLSSRPACNQTRLISAQRHCILENGSKDVCESCAFAQDDDGAMDLNNTTVGGEVLANPMISRANRCFFSAACFNNSALECPMANTSGGHVFCLSPDTKITMADGSQKEIKQIKAGDEVMAFDAKFSRGGVLRPVKVKATAITKKQPILNIDGLKITPKHKMVLASGRAVMAQDLKVGDQILKADGLVSTIANIERDLPAITVYNLVLEKGSDGYIANGLRVLSYPNMKGLGKKQASAK